MSDFTYSAPTSLNSALDAIARDGAVPFGGGSDLLVEIQERLRSPAELVDVRAVPELQGIDRREDGAIRIGAAVTLASIEHDMRLREELPALAAACAAAASSALRNMGTLGGNLCQRPRCWYFRRGVRCFKSGGDACPAIGGENQYLAILGAGRCHAVHPSDPAVALAALDAEVVVCSRSETRRVPVDAFLQPRDGDVRRETALASDELLVAVEVPRAAVGGRQRYEKLMQRGAWDFALVSLAAARRTDGAVRLVLGGVASRPWRVSESVEEDIASGGLADDDIATLAERALYDAAPLSKNAYKVQLASALLRRGIRHLVASD
ncbi:MAG: FAD binding domain-containing protein [Gemmatimonadaceae bacterium]